MTNVKPLFKIWAGVDCLESLALNVSTDFASMNYIHFAKVLRTLLAPARTKANLSIGRFSSSAIKKPLMGLIILGRKDSNLRMPGPKPGALPLGDIPLAIHLYYQFNLICQYF